MRPNSDLSPRRVDIKHPTIGKNPLKDPTQKTLRAPGACPRLNTYCNKTCPSDLVLPRVRVRTS